MKKDENLTAEDIRVLREIKNIVNRNDHREHHAKVTKGRDGKIKVYDVNMKLIS